MKKIIFLFQQEVIILAVKQPVTDRHDQPPVLGGVLFIRHLLHQSVKLGLRVPKDPHYDGLFVKLIN